MTADLAILSLKALDGLALRAEVSAHNIANAGTPGYRPRQVSFEQALVAASEQGSSAVHALTPSIEASLPRSGSADMRLDLEMQTASSTALRYAAIVDVLTREMQIEALAANPGK